MKSKSKVIAIDGPSGSGKSTIAKLLSKKLGLTYLDTGAMFRAIAYYFDNKGIDFADEVTITKALSEITFDYAKSSDVLVSINDENLSEKIRQHHVSKLASQISKVMAVRDFLKNMQREIANMRPSILEGRDIGTVIFPDAALKFFLTADGKIRAQRRLDQLKEKNPELSYSFEEIYQDIVKRDESDAKREIAPLVKAADAIELDTTQMSIDQAVEKIIEIYQKNRDLFL